MWPQGLQRIRVPPELKPAPAQVLEDYVRSRLSQYVLLLGQRLGQYAPGLGREAFDRAAAEALAYLPPGDHGQVSLEDKQLQLVFRHDCLALGCLDPQCALCQHNPNRRCTVNFDRKYLVNDVLKARCGAIIRVELIDPLTGLPVEEKLPEITLQMCVLDGNLYDTKFLESGKTFEGGMEPPEELEACALLWNKKKSTPLLVCNSGGTNDTAGFVLLNTSDGKVQLTDLHVTDSSEAILSGRKPPFRLLVRVLPMSNSRLKIRHAVSEGFVVATRRTRTAGKADIPSVDDPVSKLDHMGKETIKKLQDLATAAQQAGVEIEIPENCVQKVGEFKLLALRADQDGHLRQKLQHVLKLSKEKWDESRDHAMRAVVADSRMRAWYADRRTCDVGILFTARLGNVDLERPVGLLQNKMEGGERKTEAILVAQLSPAQRDMLRHLHPQALAAWWTQGHPGWAIFHMDSDQFLQTGSLAAGATTTTSMDAPSSPTNDSSAVSLGNMSVGAAPQRLTNGGANTSQSAEVMLPVEAAMMAKQLLQPALPSAPAALPPGMVPHQAYGAGPGGMSAPQAQLGMQGGPFGQGSGRSSRANSVSDSPPPMHHQMQQMQQQQQMQQTHMAQQQMQQQQHMQQQQMHHHAGHGGPQQSYGMGMQTQYGQPLPPMHHQQHSSYMDASSGMLGGPGQQQQMSASALMPPPPPPSAMRMMPMQPGQGQSQGPGPSGRMPQGQYGQQQQQSQYGQQQSQSFTEMLQSGPSTMYQQQAQQQPQQQRLQPQQQMQQGPDFGMVQPVMHRQHQQVANLAQYRSFSAGASNLSTQRAQTRVLSELQDDLPTRGSANPRPYKMPSMGHNRTPDADMGNMQSPTGASPQQPQSQSMMHSQQGQSMMAASPAQTPQTATPGTGPEPPMPPNPFVRVQSNRIANDPVAEQEEDTDSDDPLAVLAGLGSLPLSSGMFGPGSGQRQGAQMPQGGNGPPGQASGAPGGGNTLQQPLPSLQMIDSQQLEMALADPSMMLDVPSLTTGMSYGLFMPPGMAVPNELMGSASKELLKPTTSGLDTMVSIEMALPKPDGASAGGDGNAAANRQYAR